ncbi:MAG: ATP-grasp domain-containing protein, partial [Bdellovibrionales bacterium]|nr:ATP-grasp domain-containing protein [Bdellovibrionales bacterium]
ILLLVHSDLIPPKDVVEKEVNWSKTPWETEYDVKKCLIKAGHKVEILGAYEELKKIQVAINEYQPHVVFNLLEEFNGEAIFDQHVVSYLELLGIPYTGCNPKGLMIARDKALSKKILTYHKIPTPKFQTFPKNRRRRGGALKNFPYIVKCLNEEASLGISQASLVYNQEKLFERVDFIHEKFNTSAIAEEFIEGKEYFVGVLGNHRLETLPVWELRFDKVDDPEMQFYSTNAKFDEEYRKRKGIKTQKANLPQELEKQLQKVAKRAFRALGLSGYARMDLRVDKNGKPYLIEANPNPDISEADDFAESAKAMGIQYKDLLNRILNLGKQWTPVK